MFEHVDLQTALDAWSQEPGREVAIHRISTPPHHAAATLQQLVTGEALPPLRLSAPSLVDLPNGPGSTLACVQLAVLLVSDTNGRYVMMVSGRLTTIRVSMWRLPGCRSTRHSSCTPAWGSYAAASTSIAGTCEIVERTEGVTASFLKELLRRAMLESLHEDASAPIVTAIHTSRALDDLLKTGQQLTRSLLGVGNDPETLPPGGGLGSLPPQRGRGWVGYAQPRTGSRGFVG